MKNLKYIIIFCLPVSLFGQEKTDSANVYKKRVLENTELDLLTSYYLQDGDNAAVTGGIGTEELTDFATNINVAIPLNDDDVLSIDATISAYSSASSSNLNPFENKSGASSGGNDDDDDDDDGGSGSITGSPWVESSGASKSDNWVSLGAGYSHTSDDRNNIYSANISFANEFDYTSTGGGLNFTKLFNEKNTEIGVRLQPGNGIQQVKIETLQREAQ